MKRPSSGGRKSTRSTDKSSKGPRKTSSGPRTGKSKTGKSESTKPSRRTNERGSKSPERRFSKESAERSDKNLSKRPERGITERFSKDSSEGTAKDTGKRPYRGTTERFSKEGIVRGTKEKSGRYSKDDSSRDAKSRSVGYNREPKGKRPENTERKTGSEREKNYSGPSEGKFQSSRPPYGKGKPFVKRSGSKVPAPSDPDKGIRLNRYVANSGICSRREADELILAGVVSVNGIEIIELGTKVMPGDVVRYNGAVIRNEKPIYILLNKPKDYITTTDDPKERKTVMQLIAQTTKARVYPVGRLDRNTTGLLLLTNDGDLTTRLTHPSFETPKIYAVELDKPLKAGDLQKIAEGMELEDGFIKPDAVKYSGDDKRHVGIELHSGKNRIVRRIFAHLEYDVVKLDRVMFSGLTKKDLPRGKFRYLTDIELSMLKMMTGKKKKRSY